MFFPVTGQTRDFELVLIKTVSSTKKSFAIKLGKKDGIFIGQEGIFTTDKISVQAKVITVTHIYSQWKILAKNAQVPFKKNQMVTMSNSNISTWVKLPEKHIKRQLDVAKYKREHDVQGQLYGIRMAFVKGISEVVSDVEPDIQSERNAFHIEGYYEKFMVPNFSLGVGLRYERETSAYLNATLISNRYLGYFDLTYYFADLSTKYKLYTTLSIGAGLSKTASQETSQNGYSILLPGAKIGLLQKLSNNRLLQYELGPEWLTNIEAIPGADQQTISQLNFRFAFGYKIPF